MPDTPLAMPVADLLERIPELACPRCREALRADEFELCCVVCAARYAVREGIPRMLTDLAGFEEEAAVQDRVAVEYEQKRYADPYARAYHAWWTDMMLARIGSARRILDNGCGVGALFGRVAEERVVGLDLSAEMLRMARQRHGLLVQGNSQALPFAAESFDAVISRSLLHHLPDPAAGVREMARVLKPGGRLVLIDTNASLLSTLPRRIAYRGAHFSGEHKNLSRRFLTRCLAPWFEIDDVYYFGYLAYPLIGFPDLVPLARHIPGRRWLAPALRGFDSVISRIPLLRTQSWAILISGLRRAAPAAQA